MTNQEAIKIIRIIDRAYRTFTKTEVQALEMAIKALEQESCEECEYLKSAIRISKNIPKEMVEKVFFDTQANNPQYCDRNICVSNEYNGIGCEECEVKRC